MTSDSSYGQVIPLPARGRSTPPPTAQPTPPAVSDMLSPVPSDPSATAFVLASLASDLTAGRGPILWVQDHASRRENGTLYTAGLAAFGITRPVLQVNVSHARDVLWSMEEGASCAGLSAVVGEIHGAPAVLDFTATKRLVLRAEASGVPLYLLRSGDPGVLSAARARWRVAALPSLPHPHDSHAPGQAQWDVDLFRARGKVLGRDPGRWVARYDAHAERQADRLGLVSRPDAGPLVARDPPVSERAGR